MTTTTSASSTTISLLWSLQKGDWSAWPAMLDLLEESGIDGRGMKGMRKIKRRLECAIESAERLAIQAGLITPAELPSVIVAREFHDAVEAVDLDRVPVMSASRSISRKEQARLCRELFKRLGLKGASVTAPSYSMAQSVDVELPKRRDHTVNVNAPGLKWWLDEVAKLINNDPARVANRKCYEKVEAILAVAFPNHDDRSDSRCDHFDYRWSIN